jgi:molybdopterin-containing oxidoreductase family iron-sulfur binding subunit
VPLSVTLNPRMDETSARAHFVCPQHHFLESWDDASPVAGVYSTTQPAIAPIFGTRSAIASFLTWTGDTRTEHEAVRDTWRAEVFPRQSAIATFEAFWEKALHDGAVTIEPERVTRTLDPVGATMAYAAVAARRAQPAGVLTAVLYEKPGMRDGAHAGSPWLQEFPDPISRITWDNYACVSPELARSSGLEEGAVVALTHGAERLELPVHIQPGQHASTIAVAVGYGRTSAGPTGSNVGANAYRLVRAGDFRGYSVDGVTLQALGRTRELASIQPHSSSEGRDLVRTVSLEEALGVAGADGHGSAEASEAEGGAMWPNREYTGDKWGMSIDLNACTGCGACVLSCQAENNVPVVGREEILNQREMHWIRIDRYFDGDETNPSVGFQPIMCSQCDNATCENVCPVLATVHSSDGLNMQVYNRCVGTRYCANNCALKARRFNWFEYGHDDVLANLALNPDVTVRTRGVMEKCSFCVQRIQEAKIRARNEGRPIADGDIQTACQQSCPAQAISFGNVNDAKSRVVEHKKDPRAYVILEEINLRQAISYLATVRSTEEA